MKDEEETRRRRENVELFNNLITVIAWVFALYGLTVSLRTDLPLRLSIGFFVLVIIHTGLVLQYYHEKKKSVMENEKDMD